MLLERFWSMGFSFFGVQWVMPYVVVELLASWQGRFGGISSLEIWNAIPHYLMWCIWRERNTRCYEGCEKYLRHQNFIPHIYLRCLTPMILEFKCRCTSCILPVYMGCALVHLFNEIFTYIKKVIHVIHLDILPDLIIHQSPAVIFYLSCSKAQIKSS